MLPTITTNTDLQQELRAIAAKLIDISNRENTHLADVGLITSGIAGDLKTFANNCVKRHYELV